MFARPPRGFYEVPTVHGNLGADGGLAKFLGDYSPPLAPYLLITHYQVNCSANAVILLAFWQNPAHLKPYWKLSSSRLGRVLHVTSSSQSRNRLKCLVTLVP